MKFLAKDDLRVFSEDDRPANPLRDFKKTYQKDCFWEKCSDRYNSHFKKSNLLGRKSYVGQNPPGGPANPADMVSVQPSTLRPEIPIAGLTTKIDYVSTTHVEVPTITDGEKGPNALAANMTPNPPGSDTRHVTIIVGEQKVKLERVGVGLLWDDTFEDSELSGPAIARFADETAVNDLDNLGRKGIKLIVDKITGQTADVTVTGEWSYRKAREVETLRKERYTLDAVVGDRENILDLDAARAIGYGNYLRPQQDGALSNVSDMIQSLNFTTDTAGTGVKATELYAYMRGRTLGLVFRGREIVITRDYELPQKDMMVRYFRRHGAFYLQKDAPMALIVVP